ncbi:MAG: elongation factor G, partial [Candidatus Sedimenticola sp. 4PFRAG1]
TIQFGKKAFQSALEKARPVVLEPMVTIRITAQGEAMGDITADLSTKRGRVSNTEALNGGRMVISALVPLAELDGYSSRLKSITGGEGTYDLAFSHYDPVPDNVQRTLAQKYQESHHGGE